MKKWILSSVVAVVLFAAGYVAREILFWRVVPLSVAAMGKDSGLLAVFVLAGVAVFLQLAVPFLGVRWTYRHYREGELLGDSLPTLPTETRRNRSFGEMAVEALKRLPTLAVAVAAFAIAAIANGLLFLFAVYGLPYVVGDSDLLSIVVMGVCVGFALALQFGLPVLGVKGARRLFERVKRRDGIE